MANNILNKALTKIVFSNYPDLNLSAENLTNDMLSVSFDGESVTRLDGALVQVLSVNFYTNATVNISILKTNSKFETFMKLYQSSSILEGTALLMLDNGEQLKLHNLSFEFGDLSAGGQEAGVNITLHGILYVNQNYL